MNNIFVHGLGVVSPAGWGLKKFQECINSNTPVTPKPMIRAGWSKTLTIRQVPAPEMRPTFLGHSRLRRTSPISHHVVAAGLEAIGDEANKITATGFRLGIVSCMMSGCVNYSRRFYDEVLRDPATASPLLFPETVFNAPASHLAALLGTQTLNYTLVGDPATFLEGMAVGANWLREDRVDGCLIIGAEEADWLTSDAFHLFSRQIILSDGSGAIYLKKNKTPEALAELTLVTDSHPFLQIGDRRLAAENIRKQLPMLLPEDLLVDGLQDIAHLDGAEYGAWANCPAKRLSPKKLLGEGLMAAAAWQCVAAVDAIAQKRHRSANVSLVGCNQQAIGAHFNAVQ